jgi:cellobiose phosphorylase
MKYGHFSKDNSEYIITNPLTPRPWINFLTNETYCALVSQTGGGYSFYKDSKTERILRWQGPDLKTGRPGRYIYIRDRENGKVFSATYAPVNAKYESYECRVGWGYQTIRSKVGGVSAEVTYFVPRKETCEVWKVTVKNSSSKKRSLDLFGYLEWFIGSTDYFNYYNIAVLWNRIDFNKRLKAIVSRKTAFYEEFNIKNNPYLAFFGSSAPVTGWDCHKEKFLGKYNTCEHPKSVFEGKCTGSSCDGEEGIGALHHRLELAPGQSKTIVFTVGQTNSHQKIESILKKYRDIKNVEKELDEVKDLWKKRVTKIKVETPDKELNQLLSGWVQYQLYMCNLWSRSPSFYHEGQGGRGYRDSCQDADGIMSLDPEYARSKILKIASLVRRDGTNAPGWSDTYGPYPNRPFKDHPTWLVPAVAAYLKETGDFSLLDTKVSWLKDRWHKGGTQVKPSYGGAGIDGYGTIFDHLMAQLNFTFNDTSVHGIPRVGEADWNDALDMAGRRQIGESVWLGMALVRSLKLLSDISKAHNKTALSQSFANKAEIMKKRINKYGWDGRWYIAGYNDDLVPFGSSKNKEGKIFLNSQSWAILSGCVPPNRLPVMLNSAERYLNGKHGFDLLAPAYTVFDPGLGRIAMFSQGTKENGAVFCHAQTFMTAAYAVLGKGNKTYKALCQIMPNKQKDIELYKAEPYSYAEYLVGSDHPYMYGEGAYTWLTGTASWTFMVITELILGAGREFDGLRINPCLPSGWKKARIVRPFRGDVYDIEINNPKGKERGVKEVFVDGKKIDGNIIKPFKDKKTHKVKVVMG